MKRSFATLPALAILAAGLSITPARAAAPASTDPATTTTYPVVHTRSGNFKSTDGNSGTFVNTETDNSATSRTDVVVFTRASDSLTRTDTTTTTKNTDGSRTLDYTSTDYGATTAFSSHKTITKEKHGQFVGTGTYTTAAGVAGTLTTLETKAETVNVISAVYHAAANEITNSLRLEDDGFGFVTVKRLDLDPSGKLTETVTTRYITSSK